MKTLYIARHAKSDWGQLGYSDFDRPLNEKGLGDAKAMADHLGILNIKVDSIITSSAKRALTTAKFYAEKILTDGELIEIDEIYQAEEHDMLNLIKSLSDNYDFVMLVGHNPTFSFLVKLLSDQSVEMSAGCVIKLEIDQDSWNKVSLGSANFKKMLSPKELN